MRKPIARLISLLMGGAFVFMLVTQQYDWAAMAVAFAALAEVAYGRENRTK